MGNARVHIAGAGDVTVSDVDSALFYCIPAICYRSFGSCTQTVANGIQHGAVRRMAQRKALCKASGQSSSNLNKVHLTDGLLRRPFEG